MSAPLNLNDCHEEIARLRAELAKSEDERDQMALSRQEAWAELDAAKRTIADLRARFERMHALSVETNRALAREANRGLDAFEERLRAAGIPVDTRRPEHGTPQ